MHLSNEDGHETNAVQPLRLPARGSTANKPSRHLLTESLEKLALQRDVLMEGCNAQRDNEESRKTDELLHRDHQPEKPQKDLH